MVNVYAAISAVRGRRRQSETAGRLGILSSGGRHSGGSRVGVGSGLTGTFAVPLYAKVSRKAKILRDKITRMIAVRFASSTLCRGWSK